MREKRTWRTCPTWCWVVRWRWKDPPRSACCPLSEWLFLRSEGFGSRQLRSLRAPLGSRRQRPFPRLPSFWRCLRCWTGCCCDCSPPRCCSSRWVKLSVAGGCWAWMMGRHLSPGLETGRETSHWGMTPTLARRHLDMGEATFAVWFKQTDTHNPKIFSPHVPLLCWRVGEVTFRIQGVSWPSLSCEESLERSLERRRSRECSQPPLAPCRLIFLCSTSTRDARAWLLLVKTEDWAFLSVPLGQWTVFRESFFF